MGDQDLSACLATRGLSLNSGEEPQLVHRTQEGPEEIRPFRCKSTSCNCRKPETSELRGLYERLPSRDHIRILEILPGSGEIVECRLHLAQLAEDLYTYEALSYTWRPGHPVSQYYPPIPTVKCDGQEIIVGVNLFAALQTIRDAERPRMIWADALCINQNDIEERSQQVRKMGTIFESAFKVLIWLDEPPKEFEESPPPVHKQFAYRAFSGVCKIVNNWRERFKLEDEMAFATHTPGIACPESESLGDLMSPDSIEWQVVFRLYESKWFHRVWVLQEVSRARAAVVLWDHCEVSWNIIGTAAAIIRTNFGRISASIRRESRRSPPRRTVPTGVVNAYFMYRLSTSQSHSVPLSFTFYELLRLTRQFESTDDRDKVFGLLGLPTSDDVSLRIIPDYSKSTEEVYFGVANIILESSLSLSLLSSVQAKLDAVISKHSYDNRNRPLQTQTSPTSVPSLPIKIYQPKQNFPSWVPRWQFCSSTTLLPLHPHPSFAPSAGRHIVRMDSDNEHQLILRGIVVDTISATENTYMGLWRRGKKTAYRNLGVSYASRQTPHDLDNILRNGKFTVAKLESLAFTLTAGKNWYGFPVENRSAHLADYAKCLVKEGCVWSVRDDFIFSDSTLSEGKKWMGEQSDEQKAALTDVLSIEDLEVLSQGGNADRFLDACATVCDGRSLFKTTNGLQGVGPKCLRKADSICVLYGAGVPFVIRPNGMGCFSLIGECYVYGIMSGKVVQHLNKPGSSWKEAWISLV